jgi:hypothetical protein
MPNAQSINQACAELLNHYHKALDTYSETDFLAKQAAEVWSLGQMYEHLTTSHSFFIYQVKNCLEKRKGELGGEKTDIGKNIYQHGTFPPIKVSIPEKYRGPEPVARAISEYKVIFEQMKTDFTALVDKISADEGEYKTSHARFGMLNALEWYQNAEMHLRHHLRQQKELEEFVKINR